MAGAFNADIARRLEETAELLHQQGANHFRVQAYRDAADTLRWEKRPASEILRNEGVEGLRRLPGVGETLAVAVRDLVVTGKLPILQRLRGEADPVALLRTVPGIGRTTATRLHLELGIDTLEELEVAAHDGRLQELAGLGKKRIAGIIDSLAGRLGRVRRPVPPSHAPEPRVAELLDVDREYREQAAAGRLRRITPRRFNPSGAAWLPILHTQRGDRHYTALFSNTARAHRFCKTHDWVILYLSDPRGDLQFTVVTAARGPLQGKRVIRGREAESLCHYTDSVSIAAPDSARREVPHAQAGTEEFFRGRRSGAPARESHDSPGSFRDRAFRPRQRKQPA